MKNPLSPPGSRLPRPKTGETWTGRGRPAGWLKAYLDAGKKKEDFLIKK